VQVAVPFGSTPPLRAPPAPTSPPADSADKTPAAAGPDTGEEQMSEDEVVGEVGTPKISTPLTSL
jgi:hypothetical protein